MAVTTDVIMHRVHESEDGPPLYEVEFFQQNDHDIRTKRISSWIGDRKCSEEGHYHAFTNAERVKVTNEDPAPVFVLAPIEEKSEDQTAEPATIREV